MSEVLGPNVAEARNTTVLGLNDVDKQKLEEARQLAMSMTSHPVAFGTIEHTERAGELLAELVKWREPLTRQQIDDVMTQHYPLSSLLREEVDAFEACVRDIERLHGIGA